VKIDGSAGKSYRLTSSLALPDGNTTGIEISGVGGIPLVGATIDLNGFTVGCFPGTCAVGTGSAIGLDTALPFPPASIRVRNGTVQGGGQHGITLDVASVVEDVVALGNRGDGIRVGEWSVVTRSRAIENAVGIFAGSESQITNSAASLNTSAGIRAGAGCTITGDRISRNGSDGIDAFGGSTVSGNTAYANTADGIRAQGGSTLSRNTVVSNGSHWIHDVGGSSTVQANTARFNDGDGLNLSINTGYRENVVTGTVTGFGVDAGANVINGVVTSTP